MRYLDLVIVGAVALCFGATIWATDEKPAAKPPEPAPIEIRSQSPVLAKIDPKTLKVTYQKGADPKLVADELVKAWAQAQGALNTCLQQLQSAKQVDKD